MFPGNEGIWYHDGTIVFTSKIDNRVHAIDIAEQRYSMIWDGTSDEPLSGVDNITVEAGSGDLFVAEDGDDMQLVLITPDGLVTPFAQAAGSEHDGSEVTGPVFNPSGDRLYFSSQRGPSDKTVREIAGLESDVANGGVTWEVTGPFRGAGKAGATASPSTTLEAAQNGRQPGNSTDSDDGLPIAGIAAGAVVVTAAAGGVIWLRSRNSGQSDTPGADG